MSRTACPGDAAYVRVVGDLPSLVAERVAEQEAAASVPTTAPVDTTAPPAAREAEPAGGAAADTEGERAATPTPGESDGSPFRLPFLAAGTAVAAVAIPMAVRRRRAGEAQAAAGGNPRAVTPIPTPPSGSRTWPTGSQRPADAGPAVRASPRGRPGPRARRRAVGRRPDRVKSPPEPGHPPLASGGCDPSGTSS